MNIHSSSYHAYPFLSASESAKQPAIDASEPTNHSVKTISSENLGSVLQPVQQAKEVTKTAAEHHASQSNSSAESTSRKENQKNRLEQQQVRIEQQEIQQLSARDREVRNHERAHAAVGGQYAGAPRYQYERGPDGVNYAVAGEVSISTSPISGDPQATIQKAQVIRRAALAPAEPSPQDRAVAAQASQMEAQARIDLVEQQRQQGVKASEQSTEGAEETPEASAVETVNPPPPEENKDKSDNKISDINQSNQRLINSASATNVSALGQIFNRFA